MKRTVVILVACGSGIATSTHVAAMLQEYMNKEQLPVVFKTCGVGSLWEQADGCDLVICNTELKLRIGTPVFSGLPLLTGVGEEELLQELTETIRTLSREQWK